MTATFTFNPGISVVGIGEYIVGTTPMATIGLGSCVGLVLHDAAHQTGGLAHVMLPASQGRAERPGKYADTAVEVLVRDLVASGARKSGLVAKMVGGATMFKDFTGNLNIGERNIVTLKSILTEKGIPLELDQTGGDQGRSMMYFPAERGRILVRRGDGTCQEF